MPNRKNRGKIKKRMISIIALVLVAFLTITSVFCYIAAAFAEEADLPRDQYTLQMEFLPEQQALHIQQRLVFHNRANQSMDSVEFFLAPNIFRREDAIFYESSDMDRIFPAGYTPGGIEFSSITVNGAATTWAMVGETEIYLRVYAPLEPGESCEFAFTYMLLLTENRAFTGAYETDWRLSAFYPAACVYDAEAAEFLRTSPLSYTHWLYTQAADYSVSITLPDEYLLACTGTETSFSNADGTISWTVRAENAVEFSMAFSKRWRLRETTTDSGITLRIYANNRSGAKRAETIAQDTVAQLEAWFGRFPTGGIDIVQSDYALESQSFPGVVWLSSDLMDSHQQERMAHVLRFSIAQQYFGLAARGEPVTDAWLSDAVCEYLAYLLLEQADGHSALLKRMRRDVLPSLNVTIPGNLYITSDASLFANSAKEYQIVVKNRGAAVLHQLRQAMGLEEMLLGLRNFYEMRNSKDILTELDFVQALNQADGGSWEAFLTDWVFNLDEYTQYTKDWFVE
ncbi:MAG: hypothetical protein PUD50_09675 [Eubacteriales bacterium]|nr:hypothetical protein [Eubacteriales bacterium]